MGRVIVDRVCIDCGDSFKGSAPSRYCAACKVKRATFTCETCGDSFVQKTRGHSQRFCSSVCRFAGTQMRGHRGEWTPAQRSAIMNVAKVCQACGGDYVGHSASRYCKLSECVRRRNETKTARYRAKSDHVAERNRLLAEQDGRCAICRDEIKVPNLDHCHTTGVYRGVLCFKCNVAIGYMRDNPQILRAAVDYLERTCKCAS